MTRPDRERAEWTVRDSLTCFGLVVLAFLFVLTRAHKGAIPLEDASMLLRYSQHFAEGNGIVWNVGEHPVEGATDFLYMVTVGLIARWTHLSVIAAARVLLLLSQLSCVGVLYAASRRLFGAPVLVAAFVALYCALGTGYHFIDSLFSAPFYGLFALLSWIAVYRLIDRGVTWSRAFVFSLLGLVVGLIRPEGVFIAVFMLSSALFGVKEGRWRLTSAFLAVFAVLGGAYFLWRVHYFGYLLPNPFYVKQTHYFHNLITGTRILIEFLLPLLPVLGLGILPALRRRVAILLITLAPFLTMWCIVTLDNNGYGRFEFVMVGVVLLSIADLLSGFVRLSDPVLTAHRGLRQGLVGMCVMGAFLAAFYDLRLERYTDVNSGARELALRLKPLAGKGYTLVSTEAGTLPLYSTWRALDPLGLNDEYLAHHSGMLTDAYLDHYRPELLLYHTYWLGPLPPPTARQEAAARANFGARLPMVVTALRGYAERHGYTLAAVYGSQYCDFHYIWVRSDSPDTAAILSAVRDHPYGWQYTDAPTFDFRREEKKDTCQATLSGGRPPVPPSF